MSHMNKLNRLAQRIGQGDQQAKAEMRKGMDLCFFLMVKHFVSTGEAPAEMRRHLQEEYRRVAPQMKNGESVPIYLIAQIARNLNEHFVNSFQRKKFRTASSQDTVRF